LVYLINSKITPINYYKLKREGKNMGAGIAGVIPLKIRLDKRSNRPEIDAEYFHEGFFDNYTFDEGRGLYSIKKDILLSNYYSFLNEFYECIEEKDEITNIPNFTQYDEFETFFERDSRNAEKPFIESMPSIFSISGGTCYEHLYFYHGSYKAYLEDYSTLRHFERILPKVMTNPLAKSIKIGIYG
jgi:hypothetical protein